MELQFKKSILSCLDTPLREVRNMEQTQELKLPENLPDIGRILCAWGQPILRGKEWNGDSASFSGGMMVWVLYAPEDGSAERCLESWIPFQMKWDLPEGIPEGELRFACLTRFVDARTVSARKMMVRAGMGVQAEAFVPMETEVFTPDGEASDLELLRSTYPLRLPMEAGEKAFVVEEDLSLQESAPEPEKILYYRLQPRLTDKKVLGNKVVFRGNGNLHMLYRSDEGQLHDWDFPIPFSQYGQLEQEHGTDAQADIVLTPTGVELELDDEGHLHLKSGIASQYVITDKRLVEVVEDVYRPGREVRPEVSQLEVPVQLESRRENLYGEQNIAAEANIPVDVSFYPEFPRQTRRENGVEMTFPGQFQVLYYAPDGTLKSGSARWEGSAYLDADEGSALRAMPLAGEPQASIGNGQLQLKADFPVEITASARQQLPMVTAVEVGESLRPDPNRPTLILRRAGEGRLWDIARENGSTMEAIRQANNLHSEPAPGQMLLIPVL